jgi:hypothetical protein
MHALSIYMLWLAFKHTHQAAIMLIATKATTLRALYYAAVTRARPWGQAMAMQIPSHSRNHAEVGLPADHRVPVRNSVACTSKWPATTKKP